MRVLVVAACLVAALAVHCVDAGHDEVDRTWVTSRCQNEAKAWIYFKRGALDEVKRIKLWQDYLEDRENRRRAEEYHPFDCTMDTIYFNRSNILTEKQVFDSLCHEENVWHERAEATPDAGIKSQLNKVQSIAELFRKQMGEKLNLTECPPADQLDLRAESQLPDHAQFFENCKKLVLINYLTPRIKDLESKAEKVPQIYELRNKVYSEQRSINYDLSKSCTGSMFTCCGEKFIEETRNNVAVEAVHYLARKLSTSPTEEKIEAEQSERNWNEVFKNLCILEHKTLPGSPYYQVHPQKLDQIHRSVKKEREVLGELLHKPICPEDAIASLSQPTSYSAPILAKVDPRCEDEVRAPILCQAYRQAFNLDRQEYYARKYSVKTLDDLSTMWCNKAQSIENAKLSGKKPYMPPQGCDQATRVALTEQSQVEVDAVLDFLKLKRITDSATELRNALKVGRKAAFEILQLALKVFKKDYKGEFEPRKEQARQAYELLKAKTEDLAVVAKN